MIKEESFLSFLFFMLTFRVKGYIMNVHSKEIYKVKRGNDMTKNELKFHCESQIAKGETWAEWKKERPHGKFYEACKSILELLDENKLLVETLAENKTIPLDKVKQVREEIWKNVYEYSGTGDEVLQAYRDGFKASLQIIDKLMKEVEE